MDSEMDLSRLPALSEKSVSECRPSPNKVLIRITHACRSAIIIIIMAKYGQ